VSGDGAYEFHSNPLILDSVVYFGTDEGKSSKQGSLYALNRLSGELLWKLNVENGVPSDPAILDSLIYVVNYAGILLAVNRATGVTVWEFGRAPVEEDNSVLTDLLGESKPKRGRSNPMVLDNSVIFHGNPQKLYAVDGQSGQEIWSHKLTDKISTQLMLVDNLVAYGTESKSIVFVNSVDGTTVRVSTQPLSPRSAMKLHDGRLIYMGCLEENGSKREVASIDPDNGSVHWTASMDGLGETKGFWYSPRIHVWKDRVILGTSTGLLAGYSVSDGALVFSCQFGGRIRGIGSHRDILYVGTYGGKLYAMRLE